MLLKIIISWAGTEDQVVVKCMVHKSSWAATLKALWWNGMGPAGCQFYCIEMTKMVKKNLSVAEASLERRDIWNGWGKMIHSACGQCLLKTWHHRESAYNCRQVLSSWVFMSIIADTAFQVLWPFAVHCAGSYKPLSMGLGLMSSLLPGQET